MSRPLRKKNSLVSKTTPNPNLVNRKKNQNVTLKDALDKLYEDIESAPSFSAKIDAYLRNNTIHSRHRRIVKKTFPRRRIISRFPFDIFMADLIEYPKTGFKSHRNKA